ncbi:MAG TPA: helicase HerA-like domain-containing protein [Trebonia sp.]
MGGRGGAWGNGQARETGRAWRGEPGTRAWGARAQRGGQAGRGGSCWEALSTLPAWQVAEIPRGPDGLRAADDTARRAQALASAYTAGEPVALGWARHEPHGPVQVVGVGATAPTGANAAALRPGSAATALAAIPCWTPIAIAADALLTEPGAAYPAATDAGDGRPLPEEILLGGLAGPFGWVVMGEPIGPQGIMALAGQVARAQLMSERPDSPQSQLTARRAAARHAELRQAAATGLWSIRLLAGGGSPQEAAQVARLLCASLSLDGLPYALLRVPVYGTLGEMATGEWAPGDTEGALAEPRFPCAGSSRLLAALARAPEREVPGIRLVLRPDFDVAEADPTGLKLGLVLDPVRRPTGILRVSPRSLSRHVLVCGATGSGKSQTVRHLLESASAEGIPWLVIEPVKAEYWLMGARLAGLPGLSDLPRRGDTADVIRIRPGELDMPPSGVNPLEPSIGPDGSRFPLRAHLNMIRALFLTAFEATEPLPQVLSAALARCYELAGWDVVAGEPLQPGAKLSYPTLADLQESAMAVVRGIGYSQEVTDRVRGFVSVRIGSLRLGAPGRFLEGGHPLDFERLLARNVVLEIEDCGDDADKAFLTGAVLIRLVEYLRLRAQAEGGGPGGRAGTPRTRELHHLTVIEEAHRLLGKPPAGNGSGTAGHAAGRAAAMLAGLLAGTRAYGEGLVIADQAPSTLIPDVIKHTAVKIVHRLPALEDREAVGDTINLTDAQSRYLVTLVPGEAAVFCDGMDYPVLARIPDGSSREAAWAVGAGGAGGGSGPGSGAAGLAAASLIDVRSPSCGPACHASPCTLRQIRGAWRAGLEDPRITLWAELAVLAHLTAWPVPTLQADFRDDLLAIAPRVRDCAIAHACDLAVRSRSAVIGPRVDPAALAAHVASVLRSMAAGGHRCPQSEGQRWLAPACQWDLVVDDLAKAVREGALVRRHPHSDEWELALGHYIPGPDCSSQLESVREWQRLAWSRADQRTLIFGTGTPSAVEKAIGIRASDPNWQSELAYVLDGAFTGERWELGYLVELDTNDLPDSSPGSAEDA